MQIAVADRWLSAPCAAELACLNLYLVMRLRQKKHVVHATELVNVQHKRPKKSMKLSRLSINSLVAAAHLADTAVEAPAMSTETNV